MEMGAPYRVRNFIWMVLKGGLKTNELRATRRMATNGCCPLCNHLPESTLHLLRDCRVSKEVGRSLKLWDSEEAFFQGDLQNWILFNLVPPPWGDSHRDHIMFGITC